MQSNRFTWAVFILLLSFSPSAWAYLDPSTGSMIVSAIVGLLASLVLAVKTYWYQFIGFLRRTFRSSADHAQTGHHDNRNG